MNLEAIKYNILGETTKDLITNKGQKMRAGDYSSTLIAWKAFIWIMKKKNCATHKFSVMKSFIFYIVCDKCLKVKDSKTCCQIDLEVTTKGSIKKIFTYKIISLVDKLWSLKEHAISSICQFISWLNRSNLWKIKSSHEYSLFFPLHYIRLHALKAACYKF